MNAWSEVALEEVAAPAGFAIGPFGSRMKTCNYTVNGARVVRGLNITQRGTIEGEFVHVSDEFADSLGTARLQNGDIALPHRGAIGRAALVTEDDMVMSTSLMRVRLDQERTDPRFVAAFLSSPGGMHEILQFASTVGTPGIGQPLTSLRRVRIPLPPLAEQQRIVRVLGTFDDLIETNRSTIAGLERLMHALFQRGQFDRPLNGDPSTTVGSLLEVNPAVSKPRGEAPYVDMAMLPTNRALLPPSGRRPAQGGARFRNGDTLLARITPCLENGKTAYVTNLRVGEVGVGSTEFIVLRGRDGTDGIWSYCLARSARFRAFAIQQLGDGTSGRQRLSADAVGNYRLAVPDGAELARFRTETQPLVEGLVGLHEEVLELTRQRDELLPLLMSGRVRVSEVEGVD